MDFKEYDIKEYENQLEYFHKYYGAKFKENQGTEYILDMINKYSRSGKLIDFGSGSNIYFWLIAFNNVYNVTCVDISKEAFLINENIRTGKLYPKSCEYSLNKFKKSFTDILNTKLKYELHDILNNDFIFEEKYNSVSQFGLLGLCESKENYLKNLKKLFQLLEKDGVLFGANWVFSKKYSKIKKFDNQYLSEQLILDFSKENKCKILELKKIKIENDNNYDYVVMYALKNE